MSSTETSISIQVTAAIIVRDGKFLIAQRKLNDDMFGGLWEFPGGKVEDGETPEECLARELKEELDIEAEVGKLITSNNYEYPHGTFDLIAYKVNHISGEFVLNVHEKIKWVNVEEMADFEFPPADLPIIEKLRDYE